MAEALRDMPGSEFSPMPGDALGTGLFAFIIPLFIGLAAVYFLIIVKPDAILSPEQMVEFKRLEKQKELRRRGAKVGGAKQSRTSRRAKLRQKLRGGKSSSDGKD
uniref:Uncharacterized protein n=1 Tax=Alexandrium andersonii TaxID=327968 RepID=A0A7S2CZB8_9DINO